MRVSDIKPGELYATTSGNKVLVLDNKLWHEAIVDDSLYGGRRTVRGPGRWKNTATAQRVAWYTPSMGLPCAYIAMQSTGTWGARLETPNSIRELWSDYERREKERRAYEEKNRREAEEQRRLLQEMRLKLSSLLISCGADPDHATYVTSYKFANFGTSLEAMTWLATVLEGQVSLRWSCCWPLTAAAIQKAEVARAAAEVARATAEARARSLEEENKDLRFELDMDY